MYTQTNCLMKYPVGLCTGIKLFFVYMTYWLFECDVNIHSSEFLLKYIATVFKLYRNIASPSYLWPFISLSSFPLPPLPLHVMRAHGGFVKKN